MVYHHIKQQHKFWTFVKATYKWKRGIFQLYLPKKVINPLIFPNDILESFEAMQSEPAAPGHMIEDELVHDSKTKATPSPPPPKKIKKVSTSKKGKEKVPKLDSEAEVESEFKVSPSPAPAYKGKTTSMLRRGKVKMTAAEISHYYSSSDEEQTPSPLVHVEKQEGASNVKATIQSDGC